MLGMLGSSTTHNCTKENAIAWHRFSEGNGIYQWSVSSRLMAQQGRSFLLLIAGFCSASALGERTGIACPAPRMRRIDPTGFSFESGIIGALGP